jgi:hypothetical protein
MTRGTLALIELALETGTLPPKFSWGQMLNRLGEYCFFGWCGAQLGAKLGQDNSLAGDTDLVFDVLDVTDSDLPIYHVDQIIRGSGGDPRMAVPQIMDYLRARAS